jgi:hypothetical protein
LAFLQFSLNGALSLSLSLSLFLPFWSLPMFRYA